uniref:SAM domain-containing protein n=1 Tax=Amphimedon queenslandica TaxID=400682 RepID=A0A1X7TPG1_AMPQE
MSLRQPQQVVQLAVTFTSGYIAGIFCTLVSHPFDTVVSKLNSDIGSSPWQTFKNLGFSGMWKEKLTPDQISAVIYDSTATANLLQNDLLLPKNTSNWLDEFDPKEVSPSMSVQHPVDTHPPPPLPPRRGIILPPLSPPSPLISPVQVSTQNNCAYGIAKWQESPATEGKQPVSKMGQYFDMNRRLLADYDALKIGEFLGLMGLKQYAATFSHESVDGKLFFELDDVMLEEDLGVTSRLHRLRMMRIIKGEQHVNDFLTAYRLHVN